MDKTGSVKIFVQLQTCLLVKIMPSYLIITISGPATVYREEEEEEEEGKEEEGEEVEEERTGGEKTSSWTCSSDNASFFNQRA